MVACIDTEIVSMDEPVHQVVLGDKVYSKHVTLEEAREELEAFLGGESSSISKRGNELSSKRISDGFVLNLGCKSISKSNAEDSSAKIYVFNFEDDGGFALMSSSRETPPIFAITEEGNLDTTIEIDNPGFAIFMANLETKLLNGELNYDADTLYQDTTTTLSKQYTPSKTIKWSVFSPYRENIYKHANGLCPYWHQESPFNAKCDSAGTPAYVGCTAVACGLLMALYRHPASYKDTVLHWGNMLSDDNSADIAWLLKKIGDKENLDMDYGAVDSTRGSSAYPSDIPKTLDNFGFSHGGRFVQYTTEAVCEELKNGYPILLSGHAWLVDSIKNRNHNLSYQKGHTWIGQGLMVRSRDEYRYEGEREYTQFKGMTTHTDRYVLCNMGWGNVWYKKYNGYYLSGVFDTNAGASFSEHYSKSVIVNGTRYYYKYNLHSVIGIRK